MVEEVDYALKLAEAGAWAEAIVALQGCPDPLAAALSAAFDGRLRAERGATRERSVKRHELANLVAIALANLEAIGDGTLAGTPQRIDNICGALRAAGRLLEEMRESSADDATGAAGDGERRNARIS